MSFDWKAFIEVARLLQRRTAEETDREALHIVRLSERLGLQISVEPVKVNDHSPSLADTSPGGQKPRIERLAQMRDPAAVEGVKHAW